MTECSNCGYSLRPGWTKCPVCDTPIGERPSEEVKGESEEPEEPERPRGPEEPEEPSDENQTEDKNQEPETKEDDPDL
jgi:uncharacterized Zn finger protein (UPF0148 family)